MAKTWLITGCSSGLGKGAALAALKNGDNVIATARRLSPILEYTRDFPDTALALSMDVNDPEQIEETVRKGIERFGPIDVLINNAGYGFSATIEEGDLEDVKGLFETHFYGPIRLIKAVLPGMREKKSGTILNLSSIGAVRANPSYGYYGAAKAALEMASDALRKEVAPFGIRVVIVQPGGFRSGFFDEMHGSGEALPEYESITGSQRRENFVNPGNQPGDPMKGGAVMVEVANLAICPSRLLLGEDCIEQSRKVLEDRFREIDEWSAYSLKTAIE